MGRLLFLILLIALIVYFVKRYLGQKNPDEKTSVDNAPQPDPVASEDMVQCATCQVHIARSEAFLVKQCFYCCTAHAPKK